MIDYLHDPRTELACNTSCPRYAAGTCDYWPFPESAERWNMKPISDCLRIREVYQETTSSFHR